MAGIRDELKSQHASLRRLHDDLRDTSFAKRDWNDAVRARRTLGSDETIEHWFLAEHFLLSWSNWQGRFDRFCRYFGRPTGTFPKTWTQLTIQCELLAYILARDHTLDELIAKSWVDPDIASTRKERGRSYDIASVFMEIARNHERAALVSLAETLQPKFGPLKGEGTPVAAMSDMLQPAPFGMAQPFEMARSVVFEQNEQLMERWPELPRRVQDEVWVHLRHYLHAVLGVSWLVDAAPAMSALANLSWRKQPVSIALHEPTELSALADPISASLAALLERLKTAIAEFGYAAVADDLISADLVGGEDSLLGSDDVMVVPGHLADAARPILLAVTRGWAGKEPLAFTKIIRQVKARLIEANGAIKVVVVLCDAWDSASFQQEHREELNAHSMNGVRFLFMLVGVPESTPIPVPVGLKGAPK
jgi:hypothetical protein